MKKINVIVKEKTILELAEDGMKGDLIDLKEIAEVDTSYLESIIESGKDKVYQSKLEQAKQLINVECNQKIKELQNEIASIQKENVAALKQKELEIEKQKAEEIVQLKQQILDFEKKHEMAVESLEAKKQAEFEKMRSAESKKYGDLEHQYDLLKQQVESRIENYRLSIEAEYKQKLSNYETKLAEKESAIKQLELKYEAENTKALSEQRSQFEAELKTKEDMINNLQRAKASMNVKQTGEDLESWCNNEVTAYMQNGLFNCTWIKDNDVVKGENESKGSKADYIFKVFANDQHNDNELLASVCLDMKDENPDTIKKVKNDKYYDDLEKNREKKNCKYSVLVSNLEMDKPNVLPIFKVRDYENMYVVRPAYLMVFLNMVASLTTRFADLVLSKEAQKLELKTKLELLELFDSIKNTYLDKPLVALENDVKEIVKNSDSIKKACKNIDEQCDKINKSYISQITKKLENFDIRINKEMKKLDN